MAGARLAPLRPAACRPRAHRPLRASGPHRGPGAPLSRHGHQPHGTPRCALPAAALHGTAGPWGAAPACVPHAGLWGASPRVPLWRCVRPHGQSCAVTVWPKGARRGLTHRAPTPGPSPARSSKRSLLTAKWGPSLCRQQRAGAQPGVATGKHPEPCLARHTLPPRAWPAPGETHAAPPPSAGLWRAGAASDPVPPPVRTRGSGHRHHAFTSLVKNTANLESLGSWLYLF